MEELAEAAGLPARTVRYYRERGLLPPPRRDGRIAWYDDHHLARLRTIAGLLERGHNLNGIADLATALENGRGIHDVLGMNAPTEETPVSLSPEEMADYFEAEVTPENLAEALELGYLATDGDHLVHMSRRLLDVSSSLVRSGVPLSAVLAAGREVRAHADALAALFTGLLNAHAPDADPNTLRPLARSVVEAELSLALDHRLATAAEGRAPDSTKAADRAPDTTKRESARPKRREARDTRGPLGR
ncbi:MerR family transcriptional regulator [Streptomyces sp. 8L]|uniref:MerR family transcriptional regulator n=1 Tax=Streptomyces sp. 8L TaxID=2877242 RepID=UPI001CD7E370|nr:MerR family transcriptional regulator [Streptomyces sp. 8L]MCA1218955.1 MerR family transcriptional regulator [Streptomyces sp. 8L]